MSKGYIYIASNNFNNSKVDYVQEAVYSAESLKKVQQDAHITLYTDKELKSNCFSEIKIVDIAVRCKQTILNNSPYDKTVYIDTDTYINYDISDMFDMLDKYELLCCNDYARKRILPIPEYMNIPYAFSELNGGIIAFKKCKNFEKMMTLWNHYYDKYKNIMIYDQPSFRIAVWESNINMYLLPLEYNRRGKCTKDKVVRKKKEKDPRFGEDHLTTRIFHYHGLEQLSIEEKEKEAQSL